MILAMSMRLTISLDHLILFNILILLHLILWIFSFMLLINHKRFNLLCVYYLWPLLQVVIMLNRAVIGLVHREGT